MTRSRRGHIQHGKHINDEPQLLVRQQRVQQHEHYRRDNDGSDARLKVQTDGHEEQ